MHYTGPTYRPPFEAESLLLQVTTGCSHNACTFCSMYRDIAFAASPWDEIETDLEEAARWAPGARRVFLVNGDAFTLSAERLLGIAERICSALPSVGRIACYASVNNILTKTDAELVSLAEAGYGDLNVGVESGLDEVLSFMNKGYTLAQARESLARLRAAGLPFSLNIINAAAGPEKILAHAQANAKLVNEAQPNLIFVSPLHVDAGTPLEGLIAAGKFEECTLGQYLQEEIAFVQGLKLDDCIFFGAHVSNPVPVNAWLPRDKKDLLRVLCDGMERIPAEVLNSHPSKGAEGSLR